MTTHTLTIKNLQLNVSIRGQGSPLLLLNGLGGLIRTFDPLRYELAGYTTITLDVPGVGKSQTPRWPMRLPRHADLIAEMLKQLGFDQVDVFGVSWGGALAQEFTLRYPRMVRRLILAATSAGPAMLVKPADILDFFGRSEGAKLRKQEGSRNSIGTLLRFGVVNGMLTANPRTYYYQLTALVGWTSLLRLFRLRQRTLILTGERDPLVRLYNAHILRSTIRRAELRVLQGEGHFFVVTSARRTAEAIREFLCQQFGDEEPVLMIAKGMFKPRLLQSERN
ncbi:alpha/beta fold hydrolase [Pseudomonas sp. PCH199]|uniref:alpha/beta fold hydrolase n=1 Tax=unclassified Pseudomonas TaxID=196821 RepID=UPI000BD662A7|nr:MULTISPECIES: alpha/beta hydrolase [unclassified Pseudomonas]MCW8278415.1 alpha/beta fold hydrolase [Pseudomonas sp. PCH199]PAM81344.1 alpha/beta hydrolase [Pseudomonas sp. ERMR1:02]